MRKILNGEDIMNISSFFLENGYVGNVSVEIELDDYSELMRVNDDFKYRYGDCNGKDAIDAYNLSEVRVNVGGINFKYKVKDGSEN